MNALDHSFRRRDTTRQLGFGITRVLGGSEFRFLPARASA
jgi:hypothetical protein